MRYFRYTTMSICMIVHELFPPDVNTRYLSFAHLDKHTQRAVIFRNTLLHIRYK